MLVYLLLLVYVQEGPVISGRYVEIRGLQPGMGYGLKVRAVVANCINDLDNEVEEAAVSAGWEVRDSQVEQLRVQMQGGQQVGPSLLL